MKKTGLIILSVCGCLFMSGCMALDFLGILAKPTYGEQKIPAEYDLKANSEGGILIYVEPAIGSGAGVSLQPKIANIIKAHMVQKAKIKDQYIDPRSQASLFRSENDEFQGLSPVQIGKKLSAGLVLHVRIENYGLYEMSDRGYYGGSMTTQSVLYEVESGKVLWPVDGKGKLFRTKVELEIGGQKATTDRLLRAMGYCIVRNFYDCIRNQYRIKDEVEDVNDDKYW